MKETTRKWIAELEATPEYYAEGISLDLILKFERRRNELGISYSELARRMGVSRQRVNTLMSGTQNATIGSLVKLALALDCDLDISISTKTQPSRRNKPADNVSKELKTAEKPKPSRKGRKPVNPDEHRIG